MPLLAEEEEREVPKQAARRPRLIDELNPDPVPVIDPVVSARRAMDSLKELTSLSAEVERLLLEAGIDPNKPFPKEILSRKFTLLDKTTEYLGCPEYYKLEAAHLIPGTVAHLEAERLFAEYQQPHASVIAEKADVVCSALGDISVNTHNFFNMAFDLPPQIRIVSDQNFNAFLSATGDTTPWNTAGLTIDETVYLRESRINDQLYLQEVLKHEDYHIYSRLSYERWRTVVEGFNELMKYEDIIRDTAVLDRIKGQASIVNSYRDYAAEQYLLMQIVGRDHFIAGHLIVGESHLRTAFDSIAGDGEFENIFGSDYNIRTGRWDQRMSDEDRIDALSDIIQNSQKLTAAEKKFILDQVDDIVKVGRYAIR